MKVKRFNHTTVGVGGFGLVNGSVLNFRVNSDEVKLVLIDLGTKPEVVSASRVRGALPLSKNCIGLSVTK
jgi:hypothetical protein